MEPTACVQPKYKGDGNCDDKNNFAVCDYDGGDCCAKTVTSKKGVKTGNVVTKYCDEVGVKTLRSVYQIGSNGRLGFYGDIGCDVLPTEDVNIKTVLLAKVVCVTHN